MCDVQTAINLGIRHALVPPFPLQEQRGRMPPRMAPDNNAAYQEDEDDATTQATNLLAALQQQQQQMHTPGPFHPSLRRPRTNKESQTTPRWGALAFMALALLALEASILLGVTDIPRLFGGGGSGSSGSSPSTAGGGESCEAPALHDAGSSGGSGSGSSSPFAGLRQWMGGQQEGAALWRRYEAILDEFEGYLEERERFGGGGGKAKGWTVLSSSKDGRLRVSLRWPDAEQPGKGAPMLIAEGLYHNASAGDLFEAMRVRSTLRTMPHLDPFFEDYRVLRAYGAQAELGWRSTKRLLVYGKRDFVQASLEQEGRRRTRRWRGLGLEGKQQGGGAGGGGFLHQAKDFVSASLSIPEAVQQDAAGPFFELSEGRPGYTRGFQDLVGFYTPVSLPAHPGLPAAAATIIMRTDLRGHIPHFAFTATAGPTGMHLLRTLEKLTGAWPADRPPPQ